ncbi:MAG: Na(+)-translocating NADH-quinone reductase subunit A [Endozoicomonadaceae bacterium]|nr:Na(+)-translocating NADH-quinone reductase subunit A [Endozoicomonadaceae bacterium]
MINITRGLELPITGSPEQTITDKSDAHSVAVIGSDYAGMKPTMAVAVGDRVSLGQLLFTDKKNTDVRYTSPASGIVAAIHRGEKRIFQSLVIDIDGDKQETFSQYAPSKLRELTREQVQDNLVQSGLWTALRTRPYSKVPAPGTVPTALFVTAMDTHPLASNPEAVITEQTEAFEQGLHILSKLTDGRLFLCKAPGAVMPSGPAQVETFSGRHPAGLVGTHIHFLEPVGANKTVWHVGYQDVIAIGKLFVTGHLFVERVIALAGPQVKKPRLIRTRLGANIDEICANELRPDDNRVISGSVFGGFTAAGPYAYLGRYSNQVTVLREGRERPLLHYIRPGADRFSVMPIYVSHFMRKLFPFSTTTNGSERAMMPVGTYEKVMPLDILPTQLLRSMIISDTETAQKLGVLELDEEDLALCTYVCPGKYEYGPILRDNLTTIEKEG